MKVAKIIGVVVAVLAVALITAGLWIFWEGSPAEILAKANAIKVPSTWQLTSETVVPPKHLCLEKTGCPAIERRWKTDRIYTKDELEKMFSTASVSLDFSRERCELSKSDLSATKLLCTGYGTKQNDRYIISQDMNEKQSEVTIHFIIQPV